MSGSHSKNFQKIPIGPNNFIKYDDHFTKEDGIALHDVFRRDPHFLEALAHAVDWTARMSMRPPTPEWRRIKENELPVVEEMFDGNVIAYRVTAPPAVPGFRKEDVHVFVEKGSLVIDIDQKLPPESSPDGNKKRGVKGVISNNNSPRVRCKVEEIIAEITNGVLTVVCPKEFKNEGDADEDIGVHHIQVNYK